MCFIAASSDSDVFGKHFHDRLFAVFIYTKYGNFIYFDLD